MQNRVARAVGGGACALRNALAIFCRHAAERTLIDFAFFSAREGYAPMLELIHRFRCVAAKIFNRVLVTEPIRPLDRVIHMPAPIVGAHIAERC